MCEQLVLAQIKKLPPLPVVANRLIELINCENSSADDITQVLSSDQALAGKVLKLANSSFYGMSGKVGTISRAIVILGFSAVRNMALGLGLAQAIKKGADRSILQAFWDHALYVGAACRSVALQSNHPDPEEMFIAGILHDLGRLILELVEPGYEREIGPKPPQEMLQRETEIVGLAHTKAGHKIAKHWNLPERLGSVLRFHHHPTQWKSDESGLLAGVMLGDMLARTLGQSRELPVDPPDPVDLAHHLGLNLRKTENLLSTTCQEVMKIREFLEIAGIDTEELGEHAEMKPRRHAGTVVMLGNDPQRIEWTFSQMSRWGWQLVETEAFLNNSEICADLCVLDPRSLAPAQTEQYLRLLAARSVPVVLAAPSSEWQERLPHLTVLPPAFVEADIEALCTAR